MTSAFVLQINISNGGIPKRPIAEAVVTPLGIHGDRHAHPEVHGGPKKALLLITSEGIEELKAAGFPVYNGALGENITSTGLDRRDLRIGQRVRVGEVELELTKVRAPCFTIQVYGANIGEAVYDQDVKSGDPSSPRWGLSGFYFRVIKPGIIHPGDRITLLT
ncbi:MAG: MOSC domain-containing protein [Bryobacterales bacterium]|nr:MOSC domain-containing protein [Bryobacterales bacterium]MBV9399290.1 MOSC domain-containing protein [Bryobacterales bacterium]